MDVIGFATFSEFLASEFDWVLPPPGGYMALDECPPATGRYAQVDPNAFMVELARMAKANSGGYTWTQVLQSEIHCMMLQTHFSPEIDLILMKRIGEWIAEQQPEGHA